KWSTITTTFLPSAFLPPSGRQTVLSLWPRTRRGSASVSFTERDCPILIRSCWAVEIRLALSVWRAPQRWRSQRSRRSCAPRLPKRSRHFPPPVGAIPSSNPCRPSSDRAASRHSGHRAQSCSAPRRGDVLAKFGPPSCQLTGEDEAANSPSTPHLSLLRWAGFNDLMSPRPMTYNREKIRACHALNFASNPREFRP